MKVTSKRKRDVLKKARRLAYAEASKKVARQATSREAIVRVARAGGGLVFQCRTGLFSGPTSPPYTVKPEELVGGIDNPGELGMVVARLGLMVLSSLMRTNAWEPDVIKTTAEAACKWANIDVEALRRAAEEEAAKEATTQEPATTEQPEAEGPVL